MNGVNVSASLGLIEQYEAVLEAAPLATKCVTSWVGFTVADAVAQGLTLNGRVITPGCLICFMDHTGWYVDHAGCHQLRCF